MSAQNQKLFDTAQVCSSCESRAVTESIETTTLEYGVGVSVSLTVNEPVMRCADCGEAWTDWRGEEARAAAVERYKAVFAAPIQAKLDEAEERIHEYEVSRRWHCVAKGDFPPLSNDQKQPNSFGRPVIISPPYRSPGAADAHVAFYGCRLSDEPTFYLHGRCVEVTHWMALPEPPDE